jgi:hypothetical protein
VWPTKPQYSLAPYKKHLDPYKNSIPAFQEVSFLKRRLDHLKYIENFIIKHIEVETFKY